MRAADFMTTPVTTFSPDTSISAASGVLIDRGFNAVPVVDDQNELVGIVSQSDLLRGRISEDPRAHLRPVTTSPTEPPSTVGEVMTEKVVALPESADEVAFATAMIDNKIKIVPVVSGSRLVGVVSASDLLRARVRTDGALEADVKARLREYAGGQEPWSVTVNDGVVSLSGNVAEPHRRIAILLAETVPGVVRVHAVGQEPAGLSSTTYGSGELRAEVPRDHRGLRVLDLDECFRRLAEATVGRLGFVQAGSLVVLPVNHGLDGHDVVFRTTWGSKFQAAQQAEQVAFEVDGFDRSSRLGWSVLVKGSASLVYESPDIERMEALGVRSWASADQDMFWVRVRPEEITGREITAH
jgi:CBS domain-containing protein